MLIPNCRIATAQGGWTCTVDSPPQWTQKEFKLLDVPLMCKFESASTYSLDGSNVTSTTRHSVLKWRIGYSP